MSAYLVQNKTINRIVNYLNTKPQEWKALREIGYKLISGDAERLAVDMFKLNKEALRQRYGTQASELINGRKFQYKLVLSSPVKAIQALHNWSYQCCEGNIAETKLYKAMQEVIREIEYDIVTNLFEYKNLKWA